MSSRTPNPGIVSHGARHLPDLVVTSYNLEIKENGGFVGDRANKAAFRETLDEWRKALRKAGEDPFGDVPSDEISKQKLDEVMIAGDPTAAGLLQSAIEEFAQVLVSTIRRFQKLKAWRDVARIVVGGGFRSGRVGELAIGRAAVLLKADKDAIDLVPIHNHPDEAGLIGAVHLAPHWILEGYDGMLAVDIGGSTIRAGIISLRQNKAPDLSKASVWRMELWKHSAEKGVTRENALSELTDMLERLIERADGKSLKLAPLVGIGCPGLITEDGTIERGAQNLPGKWEGENFNLPRRIREAIPMIGKHETVVAMHNDAVVQGLSEAPFMQDVERWAVLTIGTGLGNATFAASEAAE